MKELLQLAKGAQGVRRLDLAPAIAQAAVATVAHGEIPTAELLERVGALGGEHAELALAGWLLGNPKAGPPNAGTLVRAEDDLWETARPWLRGVDALAVAGGPVAPRHRVAHALTQNVRVCDGMFPAQQGARCEERESRR